VALVRGRFLVIETADGLLVVDEPAARQRIAHHRMSQGIRQDQLSSQRLLFPVVQDVSGRALEAVVRAAAQLDRLGFELRAAGATSVSLHAIPQALGPASPQRLLVTLVEQVEHSQGRLDDVRIEALIAALARHAAPSTQRLEPEQALDLVRVLEQVDAATGEGHGRVLRRLSWSEFGQADEDPVEP
jgi:DNA mismatch repair protein MutL